MENHNPLKPPIDKPPFWKQPLTPQLVIWVAVHVVLTGLLWLAFVKDATESGVIDPHGTRDAGILLLISFSAVALVLALLKKATEWMLRVSSRSGR